jgi:hypothetical protein
VADAIVDDQTIRGEARLGDGVILSQEFCRRGPSDAGTPGARIQPDGPATAPWYRRLDDRRATMSLQRHAGLGRLPVAPAASANGASGMTARLLRRARPWPAVVAVLLALAAVLPLAATYAREYASV